MLRLWREAFATPQPPGGGSLGVNFQLAERESRSVGGLELQQRLALGLGGVVWDCGIALAALLRAQPELVRGRRVLDLGTGTGLVGLAALQAGATSALLTDLPDITPLAEANASGVGGAVVEAFDWGGEFAHDPADFDVVLCSDALYDADAFPFLVRALQATLAPGALLLMSYKRRLDDREVPFFERLEEFLDMEVYPQSEVPEGMQGTGVWLVSCRLRVSVGAGAGASAVAVAGGDAAGKGGGRGAAPRGRNWGEEAM